MGNISNTFILIGELCHLIEVAIEVYILEVNIRGLKKGAENIAPMIEHLSNKCEA
jgi:hypothetical protein